MGLSACGVVMDGDAEQLALVRDALGLSREPDARLEVYELSTREYDSDWLGIEVRANRILVHGWEVMEHTSTWRRLSEEVGQVVMFTFSENWEGANSYEIFEKGRSVRSVDEISPPDGQGMRTKGEPHPLDPELLPDRHPADVVNQMFMNRTGWSIYTNSVPDDDLVLDAWRLR